MASTWPCRVPRRGQDLILTFGDRPPARRERPAGIRWDLADVEAIRGGALVAISRADDTRRHGGTGLSHSDHDGGGLPATAPCAIWHVQRAVAQPRRPGARSAWPSWGCCRRRCSAIPPGRTHPQRPALHCHRSAEDQTQISNHPDNDCVRPYETASLFRTPVPGRHRGPVNPIFREDAVRQVRATLARSPLRQRRACRADDRLQRVRASSTTWGGFEAAGFMALARHRRDRVSQHHAGVGDAARGDGGWKSIGATPVHPALR
jgi:hypothetical protein